MSETGQAEPDLSTMSPAEPAELTEEQQDMPTVATASDEPKPTTEHCFGVPAGGVASAIPVAIAPANLVGSQSEAELKRIDETEEPKTEAREFVKFAVDSGNLFALKAAIAKAKEAKLNALEYKVAEQTLARQWEEKLKGDLKSKDFAAKRVQSHMFV